jgi:hypothetical protein
VIDHKDIRLVAKFMLKSYGGNAKTVAAQHVNERLAEGNLSGPDIWRQIVAAMQDLQRMTRREVELVN